MSKKLKPGEVEGDMIPRHFVGEHPFAGQLRAAFERGQDDFQTDQDWSRTALSYEDPDLRFAYIAGWTNAEQT